MENLNLKEESKKPKNSLCCEPESSESAQSHADISKAEALQSEFRTVIGLLSTSTYMANKRAPRALARGPIPSQHRHATPNAAQRERLCLLQAFGTLLVQKDQVNATAACRTSSSSSDGSSSLGDAYTLFVMQEEYGCESVLGDLSDLRNPTVAMNNPDSRDVNFSSLSASQGVMHMRGKSYWPSIVEDPWRFLYNSTEGFANHVATLGEYISAYATNSHARGEYFEKYSKYLVTCCWPRMHKLATHWTSDAFRYYLYRFSDENVCGAYDIAQCNLDPPKRRDAVLATYFSKIKVNGMLELIMQEHPNPNHRKSKLPHLAAAFENVSSSTTPINIYSKDTCSEFHQFLIALLSAYTKIILEIKQRSLSKSPKSSVGFSRFYNIAILLWKVARSQILRIHLRALYAAADVVGVILGMPNYQFRNLYSNYLKLAHGQAGKKKVAKREGQQEDEEQDKSRGPVGVEESDQERDMEDLRQLWNQVAAHGRKADESVVYQGWLLLLIGHFESLDILSKFCARSCTDGVRNIEVKLLAVRPRNRTLSVVNWKSTVMALAEPEHSAALDLVPANARLTHEQAKDAVTLLQEYIGANSDNMLSGIQCGLGFSNKVHCEAAMASFMKHSDWVNCGGLLPSFHDPDERLIAVPRPCCPVCLELLSILSDDSTNDFGVHGHHDAVLSTELPPWLPVPVLQEMVNRFNGHLRHVLVTLLKNSSWPGTSPLPQGN